MIKRNTSTEKKINGNYKIENESLNKQDRKTIPNKININMRIKTLQEKKGNYKRSANKSVL